MGLTLIGVDNTRAYTRARFTYERNGNAPFAFEIRQYVPKDKVSSANGSFLPIEAAANGRHVALNPQATDLRRLFDLYVPKFTAPIEVAALQYVPNGTAHKRKVEPSEHKEPVPDFNLESTLATIMQCLLMDQHDDGKT